MALLLTPFDENRSIDWTTYDAYLDWQLQAEPTGFFAVCGSSEMKWLTLEERLELARRAVKRAGDKPVLATANLEPDRSKHADEIKKMVDTGVAGIVLVPPNGLGKDSAKLKAYYEELIVTSPLPTFLYEWPLVSPYLLDADIYGDLVTNCRLAGIKDTTCTVEGITAKITSAPEGLVYQANTPYLIESLRAGARGIMAVTSAACADLVVAFWNSFQSGDEETAKHYHQLLVALDAVLRFGYPATAKHLAALRGMPMSTTTRWPIEFVPEAAKAVEVWYEMYSRVMPSKLATP